MGTGRAAWREVSLAGAAMVIAALIVAVCLIGVLAVTMYSMPAAQDSTHPVPRPSASVFHGAASPSTETQVGAESAPIHLTVRTTSVAANEIVRLTGRYRHPHGQQVLHVQLHRHGRWITFPLPAVTTASGRFQSFIDLSHRGTNRVRVIDRDNGKTSNIATVDVR